MKITCPKCKTTYRIDDNTIPEKGLVVKCSVCSTEYRVRRRSTPPPPENPLDDLFSDFKAEQNNFPDLPDHEESAAEKDTDPGGIIERTRYADTGEESGGESLDIERHSHEGLQQGAGGEEQDFLSDLFSDNPLGEVESLDIEDRLVAESTRQFEIEKPEAMEETSVGNIFIRRKRGGDILGPFVEKELEQLLEGELATMDDEISLDGVNWQELRVFLNIEEESVQEAEEFDLTSDTAIKPRLSLVGDEAEDENEIGPFEDEEVTGEVTRIEHTHIPEAGVSEIARKESARRDRRLRNRALIRILFSICAVAALAFGGYYIYSTYFVKKEKSGEFLERITESIAENSGSLNDVRKEIDRDNLRGYLRAVGIMKQYMKAGEVPANVVGLDGQIKLNLALSYGKTVEEVDKVHARLELYSRKAPDNVDIARARALYSLYKKREDEALKIVQPFGDKNDPEILYILGMISYRKKLYSEADGYFNRALIYSSGKSSKIAYAISEVKELSGDVDSALAFLNKAVSRNPNHLKSYIRKAELLIRSKKDPERTLDFLSSINGKYLSAENGFSPTEKKMRSRLVSLKGDALAALNRYEEASTQYREAMKQDPANADFVVALADLLRLQKKFALALEHYDRALSMNKKSLPAILGKSRLLILMKSPDKANLELMKIDTQKISDPHHFIALAHIYSKLKRGNEALRYFDAAIKINPALVSPYVSKALIYVDDKNINQLRKMADKIALLAKDTYAHHLVHGVLNYEEAEYEKAESHFKMALRNNGEDSKGYFYYGKLLFDKKNFVESSKLLSKAVKMDVENSEYRAALSQSLAAQGRYKEVIAILSDIPKKDHRQLKVIAESYFKLKDYDNALKYIDEAIAIHSASHLLYKKAEILLEKGDYNLADRVISTAIMLDMKDFDNYILSAKILIRKGNFKEAVEKINEAEKLNPNNQELFLLKGIIYKNLDNYREALKYFKKIDRKSGLLEKASQEIGECYLNLEKPDKAIDYFVKAIRQGNTDAYAFLAKIYYEKNSLNKAVYYYEKNLQYHPDDPNSVKQLGYIYKEWGKKKKALHYFRRFLKVSDDPEEKKMIEDEIYYLKR